MAEVNYTTCNRCHKRVRIRNAAGKLVCKACSEAARASRSPRDPRSCYGKWDFGPASDYDIRLEVGFSVMDDDYDGEDVWVDYPE